MTGWPGAAESAALTAAVRAGLPAADPRELLARAAWTMLPKAGDRVAGRLITMLGASAALDVLGAGELPMSSDLAAAVGRWRLHLEPARVVAALRSAAAHGVRLLIPDDADWPAGLADLSDHGPPALWALGTTGLLRGLDRSIALVGARAASDYGVGVAIDLAAGLADRGIGVVSGAAYGIDAAAHRSALASSAPTVAVLAGGLDRFYPAGNRDLLTRIAAEGVVLAEAPNGTAPDRWRFLDRNRLIAAMSAATVVVEAGRRSGALNTAGHAAQLGRPLGAVPGSVRAATSAGCHLLLREYDAVCIRDAADAAELVDPIAAGAPGESRTPAETRVLEVLTGRPKRAAEVADRSGLDGGEAAAALGMLQLLGEVVETAGGWSRA